MKKNKSGKCVSPKGMKSDYMPSAKKGKMSSKEMKMNKKGKKY